MTLTDSAAGFLAFSQRQLDRVAPPESRKKAWDYTINYANERPLLFAFLLTQTTLAVLPVLLFASFIISTFLFAFGAALLFTLFWIGIALLVLVPTLLTTFSIGIGAWAWGVASFVVLRWLYALVLPYSPNGDGRITAASYPPAQDHPASAPNKQVNGTSGKNL